MWFFFGDKEQIILIEIEPEDDEEDSEEEEITLAWPADDGTCPEGYDFVTDGENSWCELTEEVEETTETTETTETDEEEDDKVKTSPIDDEEIITELTLKIFQNMLETLTEIIYWSDKRRKILDDFIGLPEYETQNITWIDGTSLEEIKKLFGQGLVMLELIKNLPLFLRDIYDPVPIDP